MKVDEVLRKMRDSRDAGGFPSSVTLTYDECAFVFAEIDYLRVQHDSYLSQRDVARAEATVCRDAADSALKLVREKRATDA